MSYAAQCNIAGWPGQTAHYCCRPFCGYWILALDPDRWMLSRTLVCDDAVLRGLFDQAAALGHVRPACVISPGSC